eukprot:Gb_37931 [translate_table: standard]
MLITKEGYSKSILDCLDPIRLGDPKALCCRHTASLGKWNPCYSHNGIILGWTNDSPEDCEISLREVCGAPSPSFSYSTELVFPRGVRDIGEFVYPSSTSTTLWSSSSFSGVETRCSSLLLALLLVPFFPCELPFHPPRVAPLEAWQRPLAIPEGAY